MTGYSGSGNIDFRRERKLQEGFSVCKLESGASGAPNAVQVSGSVIAGYSIKTGIKVQTWLPQEHTSVRRRT